MPLLDSSASGPIRFPTTAWTALEEIKHSSQAERIDRRNRFIVQYYKPVFFFLRAHGHSVSGAEDWAQSFFTDLLTGDDFLQADRSRGKFRSFLLLLLKRFLSDHGNPDRRPRQQSFEEGFVSITSLLTEDDRSFEPPTHQTPEAAFMRQWARDLVAQVREQVQDLFAKRGQPEFYELFAASQDERPGQAKPTQEELGVRFGLDRDGVKYRLQQVKHAFLVKLRAAVRDQVGSDAEVDQEIGELLTLLGG